MLILSILFFSCTETTAQTDTSFWFVAPDCTWPGNAAANTQSPVYLRFTSQGSPATITISQPANPAFAPITVNIPANGVTSVDLSSRLAMVENAPANQVLNKGILIRSTSLITAYYEQSSVYNPDIFSLKGNNALGTSFLIPAQNTWSNNIIYTPPAPTNGFDIVATENNTVVTITPTANITGHNAGSPFSVTLQRGETWSAVAAGHTGPQHLAGTVITASAPIAVTTKDDFLNDPVYGTCSDLAGDQIVPVALLGRRYIAIHGFLNAPYDKVFILGTENNTTVTINGTSAGNLNAGQTISRTSGNAPLYIEASKPVYVFHISGFGCEVGGALLPPIECTGSRNVGITRSDSKPIHLLLLVPSGGEGGFTFNGSTAVIPAAQFQPVPNTGGAWRYARIDISSTLTVGSSAYISNSSREFHLGIIHGDAGGGCRYGYFSDYRGFTANASAAPVCAGSNLQLNCQVADAAGVNFSWTGPNGFSSNLQNPVISNATVAASGTYTCIATKAGCTAVTTTVSVTVSPAPVFTIQSNSPVCSGSSLNLSSTDAGAGAQYSWTGPNGFTSNLQNPVISNTTAANTGNYTLTVTRNGCSRSESTAVEVLPTISLTASNGGPYCEGQNLQLTASSNIPGTQFSWTGPNGFSSNLQNPVITGALAAASGTYTVSLNGSGCGNTSASTTVTVNPGPGATITGNAPLCEGGTLQLTGSTNSSTAAIQWSGPAGFSSSNLLVSIPNAGTANSGAYTLRASENGCTSTAVYNAVIHIRPVAAPVANSPLCAGDTLRLSNSAGTGFTYRWTGPVGFSSTLQNPVISNSTIAISGNYQLTVSATGCPDAQGSVSVTVTAVPVVDAGSNSPVCAGSTLLLHTVNTLPGTSFSWTGPGGFSAAQQNPQVTDAAPAASGRYIVTATLNGCSSRDTLEALVQALPQAAINGTSPACRFSAITLFAAPQNSATYNWSGPGTFTSLANTVNLPDFNYADTGWYYLSVTLNGCSARDSFRLRLLESPVTVFDPVPARCADAPAFNLPARETTGINGTGIFLGPGTTPDGLLNPPAAGAGNHSLVYIFTAANGCTDTASQTIQLFDLPLVNAGADRTLTRGNSVQLDGTVTPASAALQWSPPVALTATTLLTPLANPDSSITYTLTATSAEGCTASDEVFIRVIAGIFIPNAFSPNGDGRNDRWIIAGLESLPNCEVYIYNRFGELVFSSRGYTQPWDGRCRGKDQPAGAYVYIIRPNDGRRNIPLKGSLVLVR